MSELEARNNDIRAAVESRQNGDDRQTPAVANERPYAVNFRGHKLDIYRIADAYDLPTALGHALKKLLCCGRRGYKDAKTDLRECIDSIEEQLLIWKEESVE